jgi:hypothetical protein
MFFQLVRKLLDCKYQGRTMTPAELAAGIRQAVGQPSIIKMRTKRSEIVDPDMVVVGGLYDPEQDRDHEACVDIHIIFHPDQQHITLDETTFRTLCFDVAETVGHEMVHRHQHRRRRWKPIKRHVPTDPADPDRAEREYLGDPDELDAYGFTLAAELAFKHDCFQLDHALLTDSVMYKVYLKHFAQDQSVMLKLDNHISKYLCRLEVDFHEQNNRTIRRNKPRAGTR